MRTTLRQISVVYHKLCDYVNEPQAPHFSKDYLKEITMLLVWLHFRSLSEVWFWPLVHWIPASVSEQPHNFLYFREKKIITGSEIWWVGLVATKDGIGLFLRTIEQGHTCSLINASGCYSRTLHWQPWGQIQNAQTRECRHKGRVYSLLAFWPYALASGLATEQQFHRKLLFGPWVIAGDLTREYYCIRMKVGLVWHMSGVPRSVWEFQVTI